MDGPAERHGEKRIVFRECSSIGRTPECHSGGCRIVADHSLHFGPVIANGKQLRLQRRNRSSILRRSTNLLDIPVRIRVPKASIVRVSSNGRTSSVQGSSPRVASRCAEGRGSGPWWKRTRKFCGGRSSSGRAPECGSGGYGFDYRRPHQVAGVAQPGKRSCLLSERAPVRIRPPLPVWF